MRRKRGLWRGGGKGGEVKGPAEDREDVRAKRKGTGSLDYAVSAKIVVEMSPNTANDTVCG